jgi:hypothetical protein
VDREVTLADDGKTLVIRIPMTFRRRSGRKQIILPEGAKPQDPPKPEPPRPLVVALARAFRWQEMLDAGEVKSVEELGKRLDVDRSYLARTLRLAALAPDIAEVVLRGREPDGLSLERLKKPVSTNWGKQRETLGFPPSRSELAHHAHSGRLS